METIEALINEIEGEILRAKKAAFSATDIVLNRQTMLSIITRLRTSYPVCLKEAEQIRKERDEIMSKAEAYANNVMDKAEEQFREKVAETSIVQAANAEAEQIRAQADEYFNRTEYEARATAFNLLDRAEKSLADSQRIINDNKRKLIDKYEEK